MVVLPTRRTARRMFFVHPNCHRSIHEKKAETWRQKGSWLGFWAAYLRFWCWPGCFTWHFAAIGGLTHLLALDWPSNSLASICYVHFWPKKRPSGLSVNCFFNHFVEQKVPKNDRVQALGELPDVDGFLVGGASLKPTFTERFVGLFGIVVFGSWKQKKHVFLTETINYIIPRRRESPSPLLPLIQRLQNRMVRKETSLMARPSPSHTRGEWDGFGYMPKWQQLPSVLWAPAMGWSNHPSFYGCRSTNYPTPSTE